MPAGSHRFRAARCRQVRHVKSQSRHRDKIGRRGFRRAVSPHSGMSPAAPGHRCRAGAQSRRARSHRDSRCWHHPGNHWLPSGRDRSRSSRYGMGRRWHHPALRIHNYGKNCGKTYEQNWPDHGIHLKTIPSGSSHLEGCAWDPGGFKPRTLARLAELLPCQGMCYNRRAVMLRDCPTVRSGWNRGGAN
jgi:hypothetical protein